MRNGMTRTAYNIMLDAGQRGWVPKSRWQVTDAYAAGEAIAQECEYGTRIADVNPHEKYTVAWALFVIGFSSIPS